MLLWKLQLMSRGGNKKKRITELADKNEKGERERRTGTSPLVKLQTCIIDHLEKMLSRWSSILRSGLQHSWKKTRENSLLHLSSKVCQRTSASLKEATNMLQAYHLSFSIRDMYILFATSHCSMKAQHPAVWAHRLGKPRDMHKHKCNIPVSEQNQMFLSDMVEISINKKTLHQYSFCVKCPFTYLMLAIK